MEKRIVILGGGESGCGAAILAKKLGFDVFLSDFGTVFPQSIGLGATFDRELMTDIVTQIGKELNMTGHDLNLLLCQMGIQYVQSGQYLLYANYARQGLAQNRNFEYHSSEGELKTRTYLVWTERGREFIHRLVDKQLAN